MMTKKRITIKDKKIKELLKKAASLGGKKRMILYGELGTPDGRRKGGINSLKTHKRIKSGFILSTVIKNPSNNIKLTELVGVLLGDGGITLRQVKISLNLQTDKEYAIYLSKLIKELFDVNTSFLKE